MADFTSVMGKHAELPEDRQKQAGQAIGGKMDDEHANFLKTLIGLLDAGTITVGDQSTFLNEGIYNSLSEGSTAKVDVALLNIHDQVRLIEEFYRSKETPDSSPHLQTMIEHLWQQKSKLEKDVGDVLKF